jgi:N utilization substance protein B
MALCEILHQSSIPIKVSINEYIDISKDYSTPNSKSFINGVIDKLVIELKEQGKIVKSGRGLLE